MLKNNNNKLSELKAPVIFAKKSLKTKNNKLKPITNFTGLSKHFTPASQEWVSSVYTFNKNNIKLLPIADKNILFLLKSYLNLFLEHTLLKTKRKFLRSKRLSSKRVFVGQGNLKHTNNKVIITLFVYDTENLALRRVTSKLFNILYLPKKPLTKQIVYDLKGKETISYNRQHSLEEFLNLNSHITWYFSYVKRIVNKVNNSISLLNSICESLTKVIKDNKSEKSSVLTSLGITTQHYVDLSKLTGKNLISVNDKDIILNNIVKNNLFVDSSLNLKPLIYPSFLDYMRTVTNIYETKWKKSLYLYMLSNTKYEEPFISVINRLIENIYNKKVELNIVNLKKMELNSDIFTQAVTLKLRKRENNMYRVLRLSFRKLKLPKVHRINRRYLEPNKNEFLVNLIRNNYINSMFENSITSTDSLNSLILKYFSSTDDLKIITPGKFSNTTQNVTLNKFIIKHLKHLNISGIRLEAKGRLTKRSTASRSIFKLKFRGGLKNQDASFRGLSTIMLRGDFKSNIQYSKLNSKTRNGSFGVKGWISNK